MSETAPERGGSADSFFTQKYGPLPAWGWLALAAGGGFLYLRHRNAQAASAASTTSGATSGTPSYQGQPFDYGPSVAALQSEVQTLQSGQAQSAKATQPAGTPTSMPGRAEPFHTAPRNFLSLVGQPVSQATQALNSAGYQVLTIEQQGQAGVRNPSTLTPDQAAASAVQAMPVSGLQFSPGNKNVSLWVNPR